MGRLPFAITAYGAADLVMRLTRRLAIQTGGAAVFGRLSVALVRSNAQAILTPQSQRSAVPTSNGTFIGSDDGSKKEW